MKEMVRYGFVLAVICLSAAGLLAGMDSLTRDRIRAQSQAEEEGSLKDVFAEAANFEPVESDEEIIYYKAKDASGKSIGVAFKANAQGYSSTIETMVGMYTDGAISAIKVISQNETPGIGSQVAEDGFTSRFKNIRSPDTVQAITGATISSRAVIESVKKKTVEIKELLKDEK
jgi:electron transport complex protein RnfG